MRVTWVGCSIEEMAQEEMKVVGKHWVRWADMDEDSEMQEAERMCQQRMEHEWEEGMEQVEKEQQDMEIMGQEEALEQAEVVRHGDLAAMEE